MNFTWNHAVLVITLINGTLCFIGVWSKKFDDNLFQRCGLALLCMTSWSRSYSLFTEVATMDLLRSWIHMGIFFFAVGTYYKVMFRVWVSHHSWVWIRFGRRKEDRHVPL